MQERAVFCKELSPTKTEDLMNRARKELDKLKKVTKTKIAEMRRSSPEREQSKSKTKVDVSSLVKAKKNEMCVSEKNDLEISKLKKKKKHKSKSKDHTCENELNNTLSLGLRVNIELANGAIELANGANENNDVTLNPKHIKTILKKHSSHDSTVRLKEKTEKTKSDENKKQKRARLSNTKNVCKTLCQKSPEEIVENQENVEKNKIDLTLSATVIKTDKRKKLKTTDELEESVCITKHKKKKSRRESSPLEESICTEKTESSQYKRHKKDKSYDIQLEEREKKTQKKVLANSLLEVVAEHKSKKKKKKHKDIQSEDVDKDSEERKPKNCKKNEEESSCVDYSDTIKKTKKKKTIELTESLEASYNEVYCNESKDKHKHSKNTENVNESLTSDSSQMCKTKKKKHKDVKESDTSFTELKDNTEETNITETESCFNSESPNKRKRTKHKTEAFELEFQDAEVCSNKKKKEKVVEINNGCIMDKQRKKKHRKDSEEFTELIELKRKRRKFTEEEVIHSVSILTENKKQKESKNMKEDENTDLYSKSTKHKKKRDKECKDIENIDYLSKNIQEINTDESMSFLEKSKKVKRKRRLLNESDEMQNSLLESEHQTENIDSVVIDKSSEQTGRYGEDVAASEHENGQIKKRKAKKSKSKERERDEINSEVILSEIDGENTSQNFDHENGEIKKKKKKSKSKERERDEINSEFILSEIDGENTSQNFDHENGQIKKKKKKSKSKERERGEINSEVILSEIDGENTSQNLDHENGQIKKKKKKSKNKERERSEINSEVILSEMDGENTSQIVSPIRTALANKANTAFGRSPMERLLYDDPHTMVIETCTHCTQCSHHVTATISPSVPPVVNTVNVKKNMSSTPKLIDVEKPCIVDPIVIKKEPGLETENSNSEVIEPINFIDVNNITIKQEPGLETEIPPDQTSDPILLKLSKDHELQKEIKKEPGIEAKNNLNAAVPSMDMPAPETKPQLQRLEPGTEVQNNLNGAIPSMDMPAKLQLQHLEPGTEVQNNLNAAVPSMDLPEAEQQLQQLKKEHVLEQPNISHDGTSAVEDASNAPTKEAYLNSVISAEDCISGFFRHVPTSTDNTIASEHQSECVENTPSQTESPSISADIPQAESTSNVPDNDGYVAISQQQDSSKHELTSKEAETSLVQSRQRPLLEEWVYELHMVDVPQKVPFHRIARHFKVPESKVRAYSGFDSRARYKHVVVSLSNYTTCLKVSKQQRLFGSTHTFIWTFKKYSSQDS